MPEGNVLDPVDSYKRTTEKFFIDISRGISNIREEVNLVEDQRRKLMDQMQEQQKNIQALKDALVHRTGADQDLARLKDIAAAFEDNQRLLVANGSEMARLNAQVRARAQRLKQQIDMVTAANAPLETVEGRIHALNAQRQQRMEKLQDARDRADQAREQASDQVQRIRDQAADRKP